MTPGIIDGANVVLGAPANWDTSRFGDCSALHILVEDGIMYSEWHPNAEELKSLTAGNPVILMVHGLSHPPVSVCVRAE